MNYYTLLGINKNATKEEIRKAYLALAKKYHPDKFTDREEAQKMQEKFSKIANAYKILLDDNKRSEYDKTLQSVSYKEKKEKAPRTAQSKMAFKNGLEYYKQGDFWRAERYFRSAVSLSPDVPLYKSYLGLSLARQKNRAEDALRYCQEAINAEIYNSHFHVNIGIVYRILGDDEKAMKSFKEALSWNENDQRALREIQKLEGKEKKGDGFISRFFKKGG
jgi:curved DNA-binding protein CbpA